MESVLAIIVTYNNENYMRKCLDSLAQSEHPCKIMVIDNGSGDGTIGIIEQEYPHVELVRSAKNLGFGVANNIGLKKVLDEQLDYAFLLNQDAWVEQGTIGHLIEVAREHPEYNVLGPLQMNEDWCTVEPRYELYLTPDYTPGIREALDAGEFQPVYETGFVNAAAWLITRRTLETVGGFDPLFFMYGEDDDFLNRVKYHGGKAGICPGARVVHVRDNKSPITRATQDVFENRSKRLWKFLIQARIAAKDPAGDHDAEVREYSSNFRKIILYATLKFRARERKLCKGLFEQFRDELPLIRKHRELNMKKGPSFLDDATS